MEKVLILDDDLGFVFWLGHLLDDTGYSALPAKSVPDAALLLRQLDTSVDVLVINTALPGGLDFMADLHRSQPGIRVIGIVNEPLGATRHPEIDAVHSRPSILNEAAKVEWLQCVELLSKIDS